MKLAKLCQFICDCNLTLSYDLNGAVHLIDFENDKKLFEEEIYGSNSVWLPVEKICDVFSYFINGKTHNDFIWYLTKWYASIVAILSAYDYGFCELEEPPESLCIRRYPFIDNDVYVKDLGGGGGVLYVKDSRFVSNGKLALEVSIKTRKIIKKLINQV